MSFLAIDQGTSSTRALLVEASGAVQLLAQHRHRQIYPQPGWVEHDPHELVAHIKTCLEAGIAAGAEGFGLANQGESCLAWNGETKEPVSPVIVWQDARTRDVTAKLEDAGLGAVTRAISGLPPDAYFSASKLGWIVENLAEARALKDSGALRLGTTDAFFRDVLTGRFETDIATASRTGLINLETGMWDSELCALFGVPITCLPEITACNGALGAFGHLPMLASIVDQQGALYGHGCTSSGDTKITFGTGAFALRMVGTTPLRPKTGALPTIAWRQFGEQTHYALEGGVYSASAALNWAQKIGLIGTFDALETMGTQSRLADGLCFVPALSGLGCPHWDSDARGSFFGLGLQTERADMMAAILEGIAYRSAEVLAALGGEQAITPPVRIDGGLSQSGVFCQMLANITRQDIHVSAFAERTALGLALLCAHAVGEEISLPEDGTLISHDPDYPDLRAHFATACAMTKQGLNG